VAKGTGATLAQVPDNTATGGNKRGTYATDWQKFRGSAGQIAFGNSSTIVGGQRNTAGGDYSIAGGFNNIANGNSSVAFGDGNGATGSYSVTLGRSNTASAFYSVALGQQNTANSDNSIVLGGYGGNTKNIIGNVVFPASYQPISAVTGVSQTSVLILGRQTTNATATQLASDPNGAGTTNQVILQNNSAYYFKGSITSGVTGGGNSAMWSFEGGIKRGANAAATTLIQSVINRVAADAGASTWIVALSADTTNGGLAVTVTGQAATTIRWVCKIETTEMTF
jgi:hypothetical protein